MADIEYKNCGYRCSDCDKPFRALTPTNCDIRIYCNAIKKLRCPHCSGKKLTLGLSLTEAEDRDLRLPDADPFLQAANWKQRGETGLSSEAIFNWMMQLPQTYDTPRDLDDLRRCALLLEHVPSWKPRMASMAANPGWTKLAPAFLDLTDLYRSESPNLDGPAPLAAQKLEELLTA